MPMASCRARRWTAAAALAAALLAASARAAAAAAPVLSWGALETRGTFNYQWALEKTVRGTPSGQTAALSMSKGAVEEITYTVTATRSVAPTGAAVTLSGSVTISNPGGEPLTLTSIALSAAPAGGAAGGAGAGLAATCGGGLPQALAPGALVTCTWPATAYPGYPAPGAVTADVGYTANATGPGSATGTSPSFGFANVQGQYATALLTDKFDLAGLDALYQGFVGFDKSSVWRVADPSSAIPAAGLQISGTTTKTYTVRVGPFVPCTGGEGAVVPNTATLLPQQPGGAAGVPVPVTARVRLVVTGCDRPPDVNFQELETWGAVPFSWSVTNRAARTAFSMDTASGTVPVEYTLKATATPGLGSYAVSGAVFVNNVQPGILNIARLTVQLSTGQQATPSCTLTSPFISRDGLVWGGVNSGGSITTTPLNNAQVGVVTGALGTWWGGGQFGGGGGGGVGGPGWGLSGAGSFSQFVIPEFSSATCRFNISLGSTPPGSEVTIMPMLNWGFGGMYTLNQPPQIALPFSPPNRFFPVGNCITLQDQVSGAMLTITGAPQGQQLCVQGTTAPFAQPPDVNYVIDVQLPPAALADCQPGSTKLFTVANTVTAQPAAGTSAPVLAPSDPVQISAACPAPAAPSPAPVALQSAGGGALAVAIGDFKTYLVAERAWSLEHSADQDSLSFKLQEPAKLVTFKVTATKGDLSDSKYYVGGAITVTNPGDAAVTAGAVYVTAGTAKVPAACPEGALELAPKSKAVCTFKVSWNRGPVAGALGAEVTVPDDGASYAAPPAPFDWSDALRAPPRGDAATLSEHFAASAPDGAGGGAGWWAAAGGERPPDSDAQGNGITLNKSRTFEFTVKIGPFVAGCGAYELASVALLLPSDGAPAPPPARAGVKVDVAGCRKGGVAYQSLDAAGGVAGSASADGQLAAVADTPTAVVTEVYKWGVALKSDAPGAVAVARGGPPARVAVTGVAERSAVKKGVDVEGAVTLEAGGGADVDVQSATVTLVAGGAPPVSAPLSCGAGSKPGGPVKVSPGAPLTCTYRVTGVTPGDGTVTPVVTLAGGAAVSADAADYSMGDAARHVSGDCADVGAASGLLHAGVRAAWAPRLAASGAPVCASGPIPMHLEFAPPAGAECGRYAYTASLTLLPTGSGGGGDGGAASASVEFPLTVRGC